MLRLVAHRVRRDRLRIVVEIEAALEARLVAARGSGKGVQLGGLREVGLRLHERGPVVGHDLVPAVGVLAEEDEDSAHDEHEQQDQGEDGVGDPEHEADHARDEGRLVEDFGEDQEEDGVDKVIRTIQYTTRLISHIMLVNKLHTSTTSSAAKAMRRQFGLTRRLLRSFNNIGQLDVTIKILKSLRYRIKKKLNLNDDIDLRDYIENLEELIRS